MIFHVLVVDDEPLIADSIYHLLSQEEELEVFCAYSPAEALQILAHIRIDLIISDIRMPGMSGLDLLDRVNRDWPHCKCIFLTAYPQFDYAYQAISKKAVGYLLKTEEDGKILHTVKEALSSLHSVRRSPDADLQKRETDRLKQKRMIFSSIHPSQQGSQLVSALEFCGLPVPCRQLIYLVSRTDHALSEESLLNLDHCLSWQFDALSWQYTYAANLTETAVMWLLAYPGKELFSRMSGILESAQNFFQLEFGQQVSFIFCSESADEKSFVSMADLLPREIEKRNHLTNGAPFVYRLSLSDMPENDMLIASIKAHITSHIREDLSVASLSAVTHYNSDYLTRIFRQATGFTLSHYIASCRLEEIRRLMRTTDMSLNEIASYMMFSSRSYFNRFIKRETSLTPQELMMQAREGKPSGLQS